MDAACFPFCNALWLFVFRSLEKPQDLSFTSALIPLSLLVFLLATGVVLINHYFQKSLHRQRLIQERLKLEYQKDLLKSTVQAQEEERKRIGQDLHDEVGSVLSSLRILIEMAYERGSTVEDKNFLNQSKKTIDQVIYRIRNISHQLSPLMKGPFGFYDALHELFDTVNMAGTHSVNLDFKENQIPAQLSDNTSIALYRILAELINNTLKHAKANRIEAMVSYQEAIFTILYKDNGIGFTYDPNIRSRGMGLKSIEGRLNVLDASWKITLVKPQGSCIHIFVPLPL